MFDVSELIQDSFFSVDSQGAIRFANRAARELFSKNAPHPNTEPEIIGQSLATVAPWIGNIDATLQAPATRASYQARIYRTPEMTSYFLVDVTAQLEDRKKRGDLFLETLHELKGPLTTVLASIQMIMKQPASGSGALDTQSLKGLLSISLDATHRLRDHLADLTDHCRIEHGSFEISPEPGNLLQTLRSVMHAHRKKEARKGYPRELRFESPSSLPGCWDLPRLERALESLVSYGLDASPTEPWALLVRSEPGRLIFLGGALGSWPECPPESTVQPASLALQYSARVVEAHGGRLEFYDYSANRLNFIFHLPCPAS